MLWARWDKGNGQPNHARGYQPYGLISTNLLYHDGYTNSIIDGLCEKPGKDMSLFMSLSMLTNMELCIKLRTKTIIYIALFKPGIDSCR